MNSCILFLTVMLVFAGSEVKAQAKSLVGVWRLQVGKSIDLMEPSNSARFDTLSSEIKSRAVGAMTGREFAFSEDGNITVTWTSRSGPQVSTGSWAIDNSSGDLRVSIGEREVGFSYELASETTLILRAKEKKGFFNNLYLEKIN